jgi:DNA-binding NarL/FixJ family response regulator
VPPAAAIEFIVTPATLPQTRTPLIEGVRAFFEATWHGAIELTDYLRQDLPHVDAQGKRILRALAAGITDPVAAREIGISVRTYRRRVAELMKLLEAESRFQAGVRVGELGLTR